MDNLSPNTILQLASEVTLTLRGSRLIVHAGTERLELSATFLPLLDAFRAPLSLRAALSRYAAKTKLDFIEASRTLLRLHQAGVLVGHGVPITGRERGFASVGIHAKMLDDSVRTQAFLTAIRSAVRPGDVVVDLGTGTGVLAVAAAQAGARRVYAIERTGIAEVAKHLFEANAVADRITLVRGISTRVELPEPADVLVSEIIGNDPFGEQVLTYTRDAISRFLKDDARVIPSLLSVLVCGVTVSKELRRKHIFDADDARRWGDTYGIDFTPLGVLRPEQPFFVAVKPDEAATFKALGPPRELARIDLMRPPAIIDRRVQLRLDREGPLDGVAMWFELPDLGFGNGPWEAARATSWATPIWLLPKPWITRPDQVAEIIYRFTGIETSLSVEHAQIDRKH